MSSEHPTRIEGLDVTRIEDGIVVRVPAEGRVVHLDATAAILFELADGSRDAESIAEGVAELFDLTDSPVQRTVDGIAKLRAEGLLA